MRTLLLIGGGGFLGSVARYYLGTLIWHAGQQPRFPVGTLAVNLLGCVAIGLFGGWSLGREAVSNEMRLFIMTGILGGFTTFSAFGLETQGMIRDHLYGMAATYVAVSVLVGILGVGVGFRIGAG